jgi:hypothetical protein
MQADIEDKTIRKIDPHKNYLWKWIPSEGRSGGLLSGININSLDVGSFSEGKFILQLNMWDKYQKKKCNFLNVYGAPHDGDKEEFLRELASFYNKKKEPYVVGGDFNITDILVKKEGGGGGKQIVWGVQQHNFLPRTVRSAVGGWKIHLVQ